MLEGGASMDEDDITELPTRFAEAIIRRIAERMLVTGYSY